MRLRKAAIPAILALASLGNAQVSEPPFAILRSATPAESRTRGLVRLTLDLGTGARGCQALDVFQLTPSDVTWPRWRANVTTRVKVVDGTLTVYGGAGRTTLLVLRCPGVTPYALHGPFEWPVRPERQVVDLRPRRTIRGTLPDQVNPPRVIWLDGDERVGGDPWPTWWAAGPAAWECIGLRVERSGVVVAPDTQPLTYGLAPVQTWPATVQQIETRRAARGRLIRILGVSGDASELQVVALKPTISRSQPHSIRTLLTADATIAITQVSSSSFWISGSQRTTGTVIEIMGIQVATQQIAIDDWQAGLPELPIYISTAPPIRVAGQVLTAAGRSAGGSLVSVSEIYPKEQVSRVRRAGPEGPGRINGPPRRRSVAEVQTDSDGRFDIAGLGQQDYEFFAMHATLGRVTAILEPSTAPVVLRLEVPKQVRGRVVRERQPVSDVPVRTLPNLAQLAAALDPTDYLGGETVTDRQGRFVLAVPPSGSAELRIGSGHTGVVRRPLPPATEMPPLTDLGEIELPVLARLLVRIDGVEPCDLYATGPLGSPGMETIRSTRQGPALRGFRLPETGGWWLSLLCDDQEEALSPSFIPIPSDAEETSIRVRVGSASSPRPQP